MEYVDDDRRRARGLRLADELWQDSRYAWRGLRRSPVFACIAVASLALGIGANTAIFSFVDAVLLQRLAVTEPDRLVAFARTDRGERSGVVWTSRTVDALAERTPAFAGVFGWFSRPINLSAGEDGGGWVTGELVTGGYYRTLGVSPAVGRLLDDDDVRNAGADPVCVLGHGLWQRAFGGDPGVVGRTVFLNGRGYRVVGVTERGFHGAELHRRFDVGVPATRAGDFLPAFGGDAGALRLDGLSWLAPMARLQDGVTRAEAERQARLALQAIDPDRQGELWLDDGAQGLNTGRRSVHPCSRRWGSLPWSCWWRAPISRTSCSPGRRRARARSAFACVSAPRGRDSYGNCWWRPWCWRPRAGSRGSRWRTGFAARSSAS